LILRQKSLKLLEKEEKIGRLNEYLKHKKVYTVKSREIIALIG